MRELLTTTALIVLTLLSLAAAVVAVRRLRPERRGARGQHALVWVVTLGSAAVFLHRALWVNYGWQPLTAHLDGLVLIAALLGATVLFLQRRPRLETLSAFALPVLTLILAWAICASAPTYYPFKSTLHPVWMAFHLTVVYLGTLFSAVAAGAGGMFIYVQHRLRVRRDLPGVAGVTGGVSVTAGIDGRGGGGGIGGIGESGGGRLASLEMLETLIIRTATLGFALLTLGLLTGLVIATDEPGKLAPGWWYAPKILLATAAWLIYAVVMNVRFASTFRGARAAWLSIVGLVLLLATFGVATALSHQERETEANRVTSALHSEEVS